MAAPRVICRDRAGRFTVEPPAQPAKVEPDPVNFPTKSHPRFRLRVFDRKWPWRASWSQAMDDALASENASAEHGRAYLLVPAAIQQDPPDRLPWGASVEDYVRHAREEERRRCLRTSGQRR